jgi:hypothetical protein
MRTSWLVAALGAASLMFAGPAAVEAHEGHRDTGRSSWDRVNQSRPRANSRGIQFRRNAPPYGRAYGYHGRNDRRDREHDRRHRQWERQHDRAHRNGFRSERQHNRWHRSAERQHRRDHRRIYGRR